MRVIAQYSLCLGRKFLVLFIGVAPRDQTRLPPEMTPKTDAPKLLSQPTIPYPP
ncbi:hypothetical protein BC826DRAFT_1064966 [Russula brevipes]|nr:hypothetical protein BC826DRAFT_1064966 [Russula brevipes]